LCAHHYFNGLTVFVAVILTGLTSFILTFRPDLKTDLISVWILFPLDRPYKNYSLVSYPVDRSAPPKVMNVRYKIDHPYGSLIGWSVVNPKVDYVYECRWEEKG
jgi:hypothetical protein